MNDTEKNFSNKLAEVSNLVNKALKVFLPKDNSLISQTMRYAVLNGGKRLRPALVIWTAQMLGQTIKNILPAACALEYLHTYSLVHDDLPAMDNDDLRRSKPTVHKKFNYAAAILCGDALLTESFNLIVRAKASDQSVREAVYILSQYGGFKQMIGGQVEDTFETGNWNKKSRSFLLKKLKEIQLKKTAALICASLKIGAVLSNADKKTLKVLEIYGKNWDAHFKL
jgi:geranylgeranyl diphosphate synthase type II